MASFAKIHNFNKIEAHMYICIYNNLQKHLLPIKNVNNFTLFMAKY